MSNALTGNSGEVVRGGIAKRASMRGHRIMTNYAGKGYRARRTARVVADSILSVAVSEACRGAYGARE
jgi:hypothetical protein